MSSRTDFNPGLSQNGQKFVQSGFSGRAGKMAVNSYESMDAGLTIKTREGDIVTLTASRFSELSAGEYAAKGTLATEKGKASIGIHEREIQLASGEMFTFSVQGDLNEQELADIESIVAGVDSIVAEMAEGDMDEAVALALSMGSYDSVSMYEADITMKRSYAVYAEASSLDSGAAAKGKDRSEKGFPQVGNSPFMGRVSDLLAAQEQRALAHAQKPLGQLFSHYLQALEQEEKGPKFAALETAAREVDDLIQQMVKEIFGQTLDALV